MCFSESLGVSCPMVSPAHCCPTQGLEIESSRPGNMVDKAANVKEEDFMVFQGRQRI